MLCVLLFRFVVVIDYIQTVVMRFVTFFAFCLQSHAQLSFSGQHAIGASGKKYVLGLRESVRPFFRDCGERSKVIRVLALRFFRDCGN